MHTNMFSYCFGEHERPNDPPESFVPTSMKNTTNIIIIIIRRKGEDEDEYVSRF